MRCICRPAPRPCRCLPTMGLVAQQNETHVGKVTRQIAPVHLMIVDDERDRAGTAQRPIPPRPPGRRSFERTAQELRSASQGSRRADHGRLRPTHGGTETVDRESEVHFGAMCVQETKSAHRTAAATLPSPSDWVECRPSSLKVRLIQGIAHRLGCGCELQMSIFRRQPRG